MDSLPVLGFFKLPSPRSPEPASPLLCDPLNGFFSSQNLHLFIRMSPVSIFLGKLLLALLFLRSASMAFLSLAVGPTHGEGSPPHTSRVLPAPLMLYKKLSSPNGGLQICPSSVKFTSVRNTNTEVKRKCE